MAERYDTIVIGSGFGGAINACRISKHRPGKVLVLERGRRYPMGSFPRKPHEMARNFWNLPKEQRARPRKIPDDAEEHGMFDIRNYGRMDVVLCAGLGGGSLIYANVFMEPPEAVFDDRWPCKLKKPDLLPYYRVVREVLGSRPIPAMDDPRRKITRTALFHETAHRLGRESRLVDLNVFFGNDFEHPLPIGEQARNRYGALQTSCVYCAECDIGCNTHSKNTLDLNYLFAAEQRYGARILTQHLAERIVPVNTSGDDDPGADGSHGYRVYYADLQRGRAQRSDLAKRVVVAAGTLGTGELLLRARHIDRTLPRISDRLGQRFSANGDFLSFVMGTRPPADPNYGPVITQRIDFNLFNEFNRDHAFIVEDAGYPCLVGWFAEGIKPGYLRLSGMLRTAAASLRRWFTRSQAGDIGYALGDLLKGDISYNTCVLLCMGLDKSNGVLALDSNGRISLEWPCKDSLDLYNAILDAGRQFKQAVGGRTFFPLPTWEWPIRKNVAVHALGGCVLADDPGKGVTSAERTTFGEVFGYRGLYVADGSIVPTAVGANPSATISALSEMVAEGITGIVPDSSL
jgi:cholesterol oxidase